MKKTKEVYKLIIKDRAEVNNRIYIFLVSISKQKPTFNKTYLNHKYYK